MTSVIRPSPRCGAEAPTTPPEGRQPSGLAPRHVEPICPTLSAMRYRRVTARYVRFVPIRGAAAYGDVLRAIQPVPVAPRLWRPAADVCETPTGFSVVLDVAGMDDDA